MYARAIGLTLSLAFALAGPGCKEAGTLIENRTVRVGCGMCRFKLSSDKGCYWAAEIDGKVVPLGGPALPHDHENHAPDGMCNVTRDAVISGTLHEGHFVVTKLELGPADPAESPAFSPEDIH